MWFSQATMFMTAELGYPTVKAAERAGAPTTSDAAEFIRRGIFPVVQT